MSIASEITALNSNLTAAKSAVTAKGGTVGDTGLAGLAAEIESIPSGGGSTEVTGYGKLLYYWDVTENFQMSGMGCEVDIVDEETFESWWTEAGYPDRLMYEEGTWYYYDQQTYEQVTVDITKIGLSITLWGEPFAEISMYKEINVNTASGLHSADLDSTTFNLLFGLSDDEYVEINGDRVYQTYETPVKYYVGPDVTTIGDNFVRCQEIDTTYGTGVTSIGDSFQCSKSGYFYLPELTSIGNNCQIVSSRVNLPKLTSLANGDSISAQSISVPKLVSIGDACTFGGLVSSGPTTFESLQTVGNNFKIYMVCNTNTRLKFPKLTTIGNGFLSQAHFSYCQVELSRVQTIGTQFLYWATGHYIINLPSTLVSIGTGFLGSAPDAYGTITVGNLSPNIVQGDAKASISSYGYYAQVELDKQVIYQMGFAFSGNNASAWQNYFPTMNGTYSGKPYGRKTYV